MKYDTILMDADDTLLDFQKAERAAFWKVFRRYGLVPTDEVFERYRGINHGLWASFERGEITKEQILLTRFRRTFCELGLPGAQSGFPGFEEAYQTALSEGSDTVDGALEVCQRLSRTHALYVVTNGVASTQYRRMRESGLAPYFSGAFVSEEIGVQKPKKEYFDYVFARIPGFDRRRTLIVGDSLTSDIAGGRQAGIDTCWMCRGKDPGAGIEAADYIITDLRELYEVVGDREHG